MRNSIATKIMLIIFCLIVLPLAGGGAWLYQDLKSSFASEEAERGVNDLQTTHQMVDTLSSELASVVKTNAYWGDHNDALAKGDVDFITNNVLSTMDVYSIISAAYETDLTGKVIAKRENAPLGIESQLPQIVQKLGTNMTLTGLVQTDQGLQVVSLSKVTDEKGTAPSHGILYFFRPVDSNFLGTIKKVNKTEIVLYDGKKVTATTKFDSARAAGLFKQVSAQTGPVTESSQAATGQETATYDRLTDIYGNTIGFLGADTLSATGMQLRADLLKKLFYGAGLLVVMLFLFWFFFNFRLTRQLKRLSGEMGRVAAGDLTDGEMTAKLLQDKRTDEIGEIIRAFATMTDGLRLLVQRVSDESDVLSERSREFAASTQEARSTLDLIAATSSGIGQLVDRTFEQVAEASSTLFTLEQQAQNISAHSMGTVEAAEQMKLAAGSGQAHVVRSIDTMEEIKRSSEASEERVHALQEVAEEINAIVDRIKAIASQTGMLALNAAIEAARAGEQGRGFSIVASEVGKLSEQARVATEEIEELVDRIKGSVVDVTRTTGTLKDKLQDGVTAVQSTSTAFEEILRHVDQVESQIRDIQLEAEKQEAITQAGVQAVTLVKELASEMVSGVQEASVATEESLSTMEAIAENSNHLAELAEELTDDVSKFRLE